MALAFAWAAPLSAQPLPSVDQQMANPPASIVTIETTEVDGPGMVTVSGFIVGPDLVVTALHCVTTARAATVNLGPLGSAPVTEVVADDEEHDVVVLRVDRSVKLPEGLPLLADEPKVGSHVTLLRRKPDGHGERREGIVIEMTDLFGFSRRVLLSAGASPGFSGSPAIDDEGNCVGVMIAGQGEGGGNSAESHATAATVIARLIKSAGAPEVFEAWRARRFPVERLPAIRAERNARYRRTEGQFDNAQNAAGEWLKANPADWQAYWFSVGLHLLKQDYAGAQSDLDAWEKNAGHAEVMEFFRGVVALEQERYETGIEHLNKSIQIRPTTSAYCNLAGALLKLGKLEEGEATLRQAEALAPDLALPLMYRAALVYRDGRYEEAISLYRAACERSCDEKARGYLSHCLQITGRTDEAIDLVRKSLEIFPHSKELTYQLGRLLAENVQYDEGEKVLKHALELDPDFTDATAMLVYISTQQGHLQEAHRLLAATLERHPDDKDLLEQMVSLCLKRNDEGEAREWVEKLKKVDPYSANRYQTYLDRAK